MKTRIKEFDGGFIPQVKRWFFWQGICRNCSPLGRHCHHPTREAAQSTLDRYIAMKELTK